MIAESGQSSNRLFIIIAIALIGLICIGLMGLGGVFFVIQSNRAQEAAALQPVETSTPFPPTFTPTPSPTFTPTDTPEPTSTSTPVVRTATPASEDASGAISGQAVDAETPAAAGATEPDTTPTSLVDATAADTTPTPEIVPGSGGVLPTASGGVVAGMGGAVLLLLVVSGVIYRHRTTI